MIWSIFVVILNRFSVMFPSIYFVVKYSAASTETHVFQMRPMRLGAMD